MIKNRKIRRLLHQFICLLFGIFLAAGSAQLLHHDDNAALAQFVRPEAVAPQVYEGLPSFPLENEYIRKETGAVDAENTLASRLIRYHLYVKNRPPNYRFDWKLTLADYLGANQRIEEESYPGANILQRNPFESDRAIIKSLNRQQREELVQVLVSIFNPNPEPSSPSIPTPRVTPQPETTPRQAPRLPQPGDANLLRF